LLNTWINAEKKKAVTSPISVQLSGIMPILRKTTDHVKHVHRLTQKKHCNPQLENSHFFQPKTEKHWKKWPSLAVFDIPVKSTPMFKVVLLESSAGSTHPPSVKRNGTPQLPKSNMKIRLQSHSMWL
jgi:hypothetical protein